MKKKIILASFAALSAVVALPLLSAFEAHIINVTARIENALKVDTAPINFGTVFPQEQLDRRFEVALSGSFERENRVNDVEYIIRQKPKCGWTINNGQELVSDTQSGEIEVKDGQPISVCPPKPPQPTDNPNAEWGPLPLLCRYLSKHELTPDPTRDPQGNPIPDNDGSLNAFHEIGHVHLDPLTNTNKWVWNDVKGRLAKTDQDHQDIWNLDLKVPCFGGHCAQDWNDFVKGINQEADPNKFIQPQELEHKVFGCDVWIEVTEVSPFPIISN